MAGLTPLYASRTIEQSWVDGNWLDPQAKTSAELVLCRNQDEGGETS